MTGTFVPGQTLTAAELNLLGAGTVTEITTSGAGISGGPITASGNLTVQWNAGGVASIGSNLSLIGGTLSATADGTPLTVTDGVHSVANTGTILVNGGTISGSGGNATITVVGGDSPVLGASVSLTSSDILNLNTTPVTIVATPGAGSFVRFTNAALTFRNVSAAYTGGGGLALFYTDHTGLASSGTFPSAFQVASTRTITNISNTAGTVTTAQVNNLPLVLSAPTAFAGGDGTAMLTLEYVIVPSS